jgi:hypothetical protein
MAKSPNEREVKVLWGEGEGKDGSMTQRRPVGDQVDQWMEQASDALVARKYFEVERLASRALDATMTSRDFARAARIILPLQEARRMKRDMALEAASASGGRVKLVSQSLSDDAALQAEIEPGCYLVVPPRVAMEARGFRERADAAEVPVFVLTREPQMRSTMCPIVAVSPVTVRAYIQEPEAVAEVKKPVARKKKGPEDEAVSAGAGSSIIEGAFGKFVTPSVAWFAKAGEALGDAAIAACVSGDVVQRAELLYQRLLAVPEHEKLHQRLREACEEARRVKVVVPVGGLKKTVEEEEEDE